MPQDNSKNLRTLAQRKKQPKIPTADEEALEEPTIDPVWFSVLGATEGPVAAAKLLGQQIIGNEIFSGVPEEMKRLSQYAPIPKDLYDQLTASLAEGQQTKLGKFTNPANYGDKAYQTYYNLRHGTKAPAVFDPAYSTDLGDKAAYHVKNALKKLLQAPEDWAEDRRTRKVLQDAIEKLARGWSKVD